ncbi:unnamed protein product [Brassica napus]|uniref:(rape) hypothetical protein n=1 Tax=Brassica napus TaxID=3708 RepID=A0A816UD88_BRANA|nr:unnamed protein product [Brassica napus]
MSGDESEDNGNSVATESDFEDIFDENFQPDFYCSSRENTDSESEPEIKVVDLTIDTAPDTMLDEIYRLRTKCSMTKSIGCAVREINIYTSQYHSSRLDKSFSAQLNHVRDFPVDHSTVPLHYNEFAGIFHFRYRQDDSLQSEQNRA